MNKTNTSEFNEGIIKLITYTCQSVANVSILKMCLKPYNLFWCFVIVFLEPLYACYSKGCFNNECLGNGACKVGCKAGYEGDLCNSCAVGYHQTSDNYCVKCYYNCISCNSYRCTSCSGGFYGTWCENRCSTGCLHNTCDKDTGACINGCEENHYGEKCDGCITGWYMLNGSCNKCRDNCKSCTAIDECSSCKASYYGDACTSKCSSKCLNGICDQNSGYCTDGCYTGYFGGNCVACSRGCDGICDSGSGYCKCKNGYKGYQCNECLNNWFIVNKECYQCPNNCVSCLSTSACQSCTIGFYGNTCELTCSHGCLDGCHKTSGDCSSCKDGYSGDKCCVQNPNCKYCSNEISCLQCLSGYYGTNCEKLCPTNCKNSCSKDSGICNSCTGGFFGKFCNSKCRYQCLTCSSIEDCTSCKDGFFGLTCSKACPENCISCDDDEKCYQCKNGYYGAHCQSKCPVNCVICSSANDCSKCKDGFYSTYRCQHYCNSYCKACLLNYGHYCTKCLRGKFSSECNLECPKFCKHGFCKISGECSDGCVNGYKGLNCCPENCINCGGKNGVCFSDNYCNLGYSGLKCNCVSDGCSDSFCTNCQNNTMYNNGNTCCKCSSLCKNTVCNKDESCLEGCTDGFYGDRCDKRCMDKDINCLLCDENKCSECVSGFYPIQSGICSQCSDQCLNENCSRTNGTCIEGCNMGYWGFNCTQKCSKYCEKHIGSTTCDIKTGECNIGCFTNKYGKTCENDCSYNCTDAECDWKTGFCTRGCINNSYGFFCENACSTNCVATSGESKCDHESGNCILGCMIGFYGGRCQKECSRNCVNNSCSRTNGECLNGCSSGFAGRFCIQAIKQSPPPSTTTTIVGSSAGAALFLVIITVSLVFVIVSRRRKSKMKNAGDLDYMTENHQKNEAPVDNGIVPVYNNSVDSVDLNIKEPDCSTSEGANVTNPTYQNNTVSVSVNIQRISESDTDLAEVAETPFQETETPTGDTYYNAGAITRTRVTVDELAEYVSSTSKDELIDEFKKLPKDLYKPYADSQKPSNIKRNRYKGIYPYDFNRVKLDVPKGKSDYINASYIDGFQKEKEYIAALGPTDITTNNFATTWRMLWQQNVEKIVMLTNLVENGKMKCHQYWPDPNTTVSYEDVDVKCLSEEVYAEFTVRTFSVTKGSEKRVLTQFHFTAWPDRGVPRDVTCLLEFRNKVQSIKTKANGPTVVHCSAGVGRTGTYIALDYLTKEGEETKSVDVFECVTNLRSQRTYMVQTEEQYIYIHDAIVHSLTFDSKPIPSDIFQEYMKTLDKATLQQKFKMLMSFKERPQADEDEAVKRNSTFSDKNHPKADIPGDRYRAKLHLSGLFGSSDYINAVFIDTYKERFRYIVTQAPMDSTTEDFLILLVQENISCIVDMQPDQSQKEKYGRYLPIDDPCVSHGKFNLSCKIRESSRHYIDREFTLKWNEKTKEEQKSCIHYQYTAWDAKTCTPSSPNDFVSFVRMVDSKSKEQLSDGKILIHCMTGSERSCLFPIVSNLIQKMETEQQVSVVNVVRQIKSRRGKAMPNKEQYLFCHQCICVFLESYDTYSNFV